MSYSAKGCTSSAKLSPSCPTKFLPSTAITLLRAEGHQKKIVLAIQHLLLMPQAVFDAYCCNDAFAKTIRNYQYIVEENNSVCPYLNKKWGPIYFRMTVQAATYLSTPDAHAGRDGGLHYEHAVPVVMVKERLKVLRSASYPNPVPVAKIKDTLIASEIILITKEQQKELDNSSKSKSQGLGFRKTMPDTAPGKRWDWDVDCHLLRICKISKQIVGWRGID